MDAHYGRPGATAQLRGLLESAPCRDDSGSRWGSCSPARPARPTRPHRSSCWSQSTERPRRRSPDCDPRAGCRTSSASRRRASSPRWSLSRREDVCGRARGAGTGLRSCGPRWRRERSRTSTASSTSCCPCPAPSSPGSATPRGFREAKSDCRSFPGVDRSGSTSACGATRERRPARSSSTAGDSARSSSRPSGPSTRSTSPKTRRDAPRTASCFTSSSRPVLPTSVPPATTVPSRPPSQRSG